MTIRMSEVKSLCDRNEIALVEASRKPQLEELSAGQLRQQAVRARKLVDKWRDLSRSQSRAHGRQVGVSKDESRSTRKEEIFAEALASFEARLAMVAPVGAAKTTPGQPKQVRSQGHRASRAETRKVLRKEKISQNRKGAAPAAAAASVAKGAKSAAAAPATASKAKKSAATAKQPAAAGAAKPSAAPKRKVGRKHATAPAALVPSLVSKQSKQLSPRGVVSTSPAKQRAAVTAAKQVRIAKSGLTTRTRGHVSARGRRAQKRRDVRNG
jgi:hypothetical protein